MKNSSLGYTVGYATDWLKDHRGSGKAPVSENDIAVGDGNMIQLATAISHPLVKGTAQTGAE
jgi:hypothetical protein